HRQRIASVAFSPDGRTVLTGAEGAEREGHSARLWDVASGRPVGPPLRHPGAGTVMTVGFSGDGETVFTGSRRDQGTVRLWDAATGQPRGQPLAHKEFDFVYDATFSPDGRTVLTGSTGAIGGAATLFDAATGQPLPGPELETREVGAVAFSPD